MSNMEQKRKRSQSKNASDMVSSESLPAAYSHRAGVWTDEEDELLYSWQQRIGNKWSEVARHIPGKTGQQCAQRWRHKVNPDIKRDKWSEEEDTLLVQLVHRYGNHWAQIARNVPGRTDQQCMGRWKRHLDPNIKRADWSFNEDVVLCALYFRYQTQWSAIARGLDGRTPQQCRTRWQNLSQSQFLKTYQKDIEAVDIEAVERMQMEINQQRESITGLPTATTRARMPKKKKGGGKKYAVGSGGVRKDHKASTHQSAGASVMVPTAATLLDVAQNPYEHLGSLGTLQYPPGLSPPQKYRSHLPPVPPKGPNFHAYTTSGRRGTMPTLAGRAPRSGGRQSRTAFDETTYQIELVDRMWSSPTAFASRGAPAHAFSSRMQNADLQAFVPVPSSSRDALEDDMMLPVNRFHQHMTPLKPKIESTGGNASLEETGSGSSGEKNHVGKDGSRIGSHVPEEQGRLNRFLHSDDKDAGAIFGLEYLTDEKVPGSRTPLSALKHAPKTAISPLLADLLCSPLINKDQLRGMQSMQALLASPPGGIRRGSNLLATPESNRLGSDVRRCLDMSEAVTSSLGGMSGSKLPGTITDDSLSTPGHIGSRPPLVLDSMGRLSTGSVIMKNGMSAETEQTHYPLYDNGGAKRQPFAQMPVFNAMDTFVPGSTGIGDVVPPIGQPGALHGTMGAANVPSSSFHYLAGNDKGVKKRRLSIDNVRMSLHALLDKA